ncbi:MAG: helix-turn-helix domain-containing protein [Sphaerobacter sp.]|nr:helix-turn-helix domain-containing protein [Sphaerobacter sp.]
MIPDLHVTFLDLDQAAKLVGRSRRTIERWIKDGRLAAVELPDANRRRGEHRQYVLETDLLDAEHHARRTQRETRFKPRSVV